MTNNDHLESKTLNILKNGYMPTDNKNLLTWGSLTALFIVSVASSFQLGYSQASTAITNNFASLAEYRRLEQVIINDYNKSQRTRSGLSKQHNPKAPPRDHSPIYYLDSNGSPVLIN